MRTTATYVLLILLAASCILYIGCPATIVDPPPQTLFSLSAEEVFSTESSIKIEYAHSDSITMRLTRNGRTIVDKARMMKELVINDTLLTPKYAYSYTAYKLENGVAVDSSQPLSIATMDTTSSEYIWQTYTFGNGSSSDVYDVAIVNDTLIYAVGEIYILDSLSREETRYNVTISNGKSWELRSLTYNGISPVIKSVYSMNENVIWLDPWFFWNGKKFEELIIDPLLMGVVVKKMWANSTDLFVVGNNGFIARRSRTNNSWRKVNSGTSTDVQDITGTINSKTNKEEMFCAVTDYFEPKERKILRISDGNVVDSLAWTVGRDVVSVWTPNGLSFYTCGDGVHRGRDGRWKEIGFEERFYTSKVLGNAANDIVVVGSFGFIAHYNGSRWKWYPELFNNVSYNSVAVRKDLIVAVGFGGGKGIITVGKRK